MVSSLFFKTLLVNGTWRSNVRVMCTDGVISSIDHGAELSAADEVHAIGIPGVSSVHGHAFQRGMAGLAEVRGNSGEDSFWSWREVMYRFLNVMTPDDLEAIAAQVYMESLEAGFTRVGEFHYLHHGPDGTRYDNPAEMSTRLVAAAAQTGVGLTLLPVFYAHGGFGGQPASQGQRRFINDLDGYARLWENAQKAVGSLPNGVIGIAPHSLRAVTPDELSTLVRAHPCGPIHIHVAEQMKEVNDCVKWSGKRPVEWLLDHYALSDRWCLVHATHMEPTETVSLARSGAVVGLCPITEANLGDGIFDAVRYLSNGGALGVGSDSNVRISLSEELRLAEYSQRLLHQARNVLARPGQSTGRRLFDLALDGGARAMGAPKGDLCVGAPADIVSLKDSSPFCTARSGDAFLDGWIFCADSVAIDCVWVAGEKTVCCGRHRDHEAITQRFADCLQRLLG